MGKNAMREGPWPPLTVNQQDLVSSVKSMGNDLYDLIDAIGIQHGESRELSLAKTNLEQAVMWAVKDITTEGKC